MRKDSFASAMFDSRLAASSTASPVVQCSQRRHASSSSWGSSRARQRHQRRVTCSPGVLAALHLLVAGCAAWVQVQRDCAPGCTERGEPTGTPTLGATHRCTRPCRRVPGPRTTERDWQLHLAVRAHLAAPPVMPLQGTATASWAFANAPTGGEVSRWRPGATLRPVGHEGGSGDRCRARCTRAGAACEVPVLGACRTSLEHPYMIYGSVLFKVRKATVGRKQPGPDSGRRWVVAPDADAALRCRLLPVRSRASA